MYVIGLLLDDGNIYPMYWTKTPLSHKTLKREYKRFKHQKDVVRCTCRWWSTLYKTPKEMLNELDEY